MEYKFISICLCVVLKLASVGGQNPTLKVNSTSVFEQQTVELICEHSPTPVVSWFLNTTLITVAAEINGVCNFSANYIPYIFSECSCGNSRQSCTLRPLSLSNNGEVWTCAITDPNTSALLRSNEQTWTVKAIPTMPISTSTTDNLCTTDWTVSCTLGTIVLIFGAMCSCVLILYLVVGAWELSGFDKGGWKQVLIGLVILVIVDGLLLGPGIGLIVNKQKGLRDGLVITSLVFGSLGVLFWMAILISSIYIAIAIYLEEKQDEPAPAAPAK